MQQRSSSSCSFSFLQEAVLSSSGTLNVPFNLGEFHSVQAPYKANTTKCSDNRSASLLSSPMLDSDELEEGHESNCSL